MNMLQFIKNSTGIELNSKQVEQLNEYSRILAQENEKYNLTAITEPSEVWEKHFADSRIFTIDANTIAEEILKRPITNTIMLGAFAAISGKISFDDISEAIRQYMPEKLHEKNIGAVEAAITAAKEALV